MYFFAQKMIGEEEMIILINNVAVGLSSSANSEILAGNNLNGEKQRWRVKKKKKLKWEDDRFKKHHQTLFGEGFRKTGILVSKFFLQTCELISFQA